MLGDKKQGARARSCKEEDRSAEKREHGKRYNMGLESEMRQMQETR